MKVLFSIAGVDVRQLEDGSLDWLAGLMIDADGAYRAYHPQNKGLDHIDNAKDGKGGWCGIVVDPDGKPVIQGENDPAPGYYVSPTAYSFPGFARRDPRRYVDIQRACPTLLCRRRLVSACPASSSVAAP